MTNKVIIQNLKNISMLEFEMPGAGVWLLTGENGAGKTTLLACLRRLGQKNAFPVSFPTSAESDRLDGFRDSSVTYLASSRSVQYKYSGKRWIPSPKSQANVLEDFLFKDVLYIGANADRLTPKPEDFRPSNARSVSKEITAAANRIFATERFNQLRTHNVTRGNNPAYIFRLGKDSPYDYYSEKNFSLGELCVLKLLRMLKECKNGSLVLIDELEMALHPAAQSRLYGYLREISREKRLTTIFSTHSVTLIKEALRSTILYLQKADGYWQIVKDPYKSVVLGGIAGSEERAPDLITYVEDDCAANCLRKLISLHNAERLRKDPMDKLHWVVVPVGGYNNVVSFLDRHRTFYHADVRFGAVLDDDVKSDTLKEWKERERHDLLATFQTHSQKIAYLPWTPEVYIVEYIASTSDFAQTLQGHLSSAPISLAQVEIPVKKGAPDLSRKEAKKALARIVDAVCSQTNTSNAEVQRFIAEMAAAAFRTSEPHEVRELLKKAQSATN